MTSCDTTSTSTTLPTGTIGGVVDRKQADVAGLEVLVLLDRANRRRIRPADFGIGVVPVPLRRRRLDRHVGLRNDELVGEQPKRRDGDHDEHDHGQNGPRDFERPVVSRARWDRIRVLVEAEDDVAAAGPAPGATCRPPPASGSHCAATECRRRSGCWPEESRSGPASGAPSSAARPGPVSANVATAASPAPNRNRPSSLHRQPLHMSVPRRVLRLTQTRRPASVLLLAATIHRAAED